MIKKILFLAFLSVFIYGLFIEPNKLSVTKYTVRENSLRGIRIVFVSDFHIKLNEYNKLKKIIKTINAQDADIVLSAGGFLTGKPEKSMPIETIAGALSMIETKNNFYTVFGDEDSKIDKKDAIKAFAKYKNLKVIENTNKKLLIKGKVFYIAGMEDIISGNPDIIQTLKGASLPVIVLTHSPDIYPQIPRSIPLTLAGHTHGGQIKIPPFDPMIIRSKYANRYSYGLIEEEKGKKMIVTRGIGTSGFPMRINCPPEIVVIEFI